MMDDMWKVKTMLDKELKRLCWKLLYFGTSGVYKCMTVEDGIMFEMQ